ncbi:hypothetical protein [uncultured Porphyromonas sp.]|uniref:hypothetical protein n=1 Tax=uncultured Porphyromonas sp. TaxID=159274 RepID=UPI00280472F2|nr:hypothetical protein [uncultured Porphyromonas sp.]
MPLSYTPIRARYSSSLPSTHYADDASKPDKDESLYGAPMVICTDLKTLSSPALIDRLKRSCKAERYNIDNDNAGGLTM